jgi:hypothetical protein
MECGTRYTAACLNSNLFSKKSRRHNTNTWSPGLWSSRANEFWCVRTGPDATGTVWTLLLVSSTPVNAATGRSHLGSVRILGSLRNPCREFEDYAPNRINRWIKSTKAVSLLARENRGGTGGALAAVFSRRRHVINDSCHEKNTGAIGSSPLGSASRVKGTRTGSAIAAWESSVR